MHTPSVSALFTCSSFCMMIFSKFKGCFLKLWMRCTTQSSNLLFNSACRFSSSIPLALMSFGNGNPFAISTRFVGFRVRRHCDPPNISVFQLVVISSAVALLSVSIITRPSEVFMT